MKYSKNIFTYLLKENGLNRYLITSSLGNMHFYIVNTPLKHNWKSDQLHEIDPTHFSSGVALINIHRLLKRTENVYLTVDFLSHTITYKFFGGIKSVVIKYLTECICFLFLPCAREVWKHKDIIDIRRKIR